MRQKSRFQIARRFLVFWTLFIGIGAVAGALVMLHLQILLEERSL